MTNTHGDDQPGLDPAARDEVPGADAAAHDEAPGEPDLDRIIADVRAEHGPPPSAVSDTARAAARAAYAMRRDDAVMSEIGHDSAEAPPAAVRDAAALAAAPRYLRFDTRETTLGLEVTAADEYRTLVGRVDPPGPTSAQIRTPGATAWAAVDEDGAFVAHHIPPGPVSLVLHHPAALSVATPWLTV